MTFKEAYDDIMKMFKDATDGQGWTIHYRNVDVLRSSADSTFAVVMFNHVEGRQTSLGGVGHRNFIRRGLLSVMIYVPGGNGLSEAYAAAKIVSDAYEGKRSENNVWFRDVRIVEEGLEGRFFRIDVLADAEYYEIK